MMAGVEKMFDLYAYDAEADEYMVYTQDISHLSNPSDPTWGDGDVNRDNLVTEADLNIAMANLGGDNAAWGEGNMDSDCDVDRDDINIIQQNMGRIYYEIGNIDEILIR